MTKCDVCDRATFLSKATTFPNNDVVICRRSSCQSVANEAKLRYYEMGENGVMDIVQGAKQ